MRRSIRHPSRLYAELLVEAELLADRLERTRRAIGELEELFDLPL